MSPLPPHICRAPLAPVHFLRHLPVDRGVSRAGWSIVGSGVRASHHNLAQSTGFLFEGSVVLKSNF